MKTIITIPRQEEDRRIITATKDQLETEDRPDRGILTTEDRIMEDRIPITEDQIIITDTKNKKLFLVYS